jgi:antitoxin FitA
MSGEDNNIVETTVAQVTEELLRLGFGADQRVSIIIETIEDVGTARQELRVRVRAARHGRSIDTEAGSMLGEAAGERDETEPHLVEAIRRRFAPLGGADDIELPRREDVGDPPSFEP